MTEQKRAIIYLGKALMGVSLTTIAAIGSATGIPWLAGATALPAAIAASETLHSLLETREDIHIELPSPPSWTRSTQDWQSVCLKLEQSFPHILDSVAERLRHTQDIPTNRHLRQALTFAIEEAFPRWEVPEQERRLIATYVAPLLTEKTLEVLKPLRDEVRMNTLSERIESIAEMTTAVFDRLNATQHTPLPPPVLTAPTMANKSNASSIAAMLEHKLSKDAYDVYMCYNEVDEDEVFAIGDNLKAHGILPWFDVLARPGTMKRQQQDKLITMITAAAILVGHHTIEGWQEMQMYALLDQFVERECRVIPVLLKSAPPIPKLPPFLKAIVWVDYHRSTPDPLNHLIWGITGVHPGD